MKRISTMLAFLFLLLLAACGAVESEETATSPQDSVNSENGETAVAVTSFTPAQNVAEAAQLRADDHTEGAVEPIVTIIEYGDFQ